MKKVPLPLLISLPGILIIFGLTIYLYKIANNYKEKLDNIMKKKTYDRTFSLYIDDANDLIATAQKFLYIPDADARPQIQKLAQETQDLLTQILDHYPDSSSSYLLRSRASSLLYDFDNELKDLNKYIELTSQDDPLSYYYKALCQTHTLARLIMTQEDLKLDDKTASLCIKNLMNFRLSAKTRSSKIKDLWGNYIYETKYIFSDALIKFYRGDLPEASDGFVACMDTDPGFYQALIMKLTCELLLQNYPAALGSASSLQKLVPNLADSYALKGFVLYKQNLYEQALEQFEEALRIDKRFYHTYYLIGRIYTNQGDLQKADDYFERSLLINLDFYQAITQKGNINYQIYKKNGGSEHLKKAKELMDRALVLEPISHEAHLLHSRILFDLEQYDQALKDLDFILNTKPDDPASRLLRARVYIKKGQKKQSIADIKFLLDNNYKSEELDKLLKEIEKLPD